MKNFLEDTEALLYADCASSPSCRGPLAEDAAAVVVECETGQLFV